MRKFSFFEIDSNHEKDVLAGLANANWNGNKVSVELSKPPSSGGDFRKSSKGNSKKRFGPKRKSSSNKRKRAAHPVSQSMEHRQQNLENLLPLNPKPQSRNRSWLSLVKMISGK